MYQTTDFRKGLKIEIEGKPWIIVDFQHVNPGKGSAFVRTKMKNIKNGKVVEQNIPAGHNIETARVERRKFQYLYNDETGYHFMNNESFEQVSIDKDFISTIIEGRTRCRNVTSRRD